MGCWSCVIRRVVRPVLPEHRVGESKNKGGKAKRQAAVYDSHEHMPFKGPVAWSADS